MRNTQTQTRTHVRTRTHKNPAIPHAAMVPRSHGPHLPHAVCCMAHGAAIAPSSEADRNYFGSLRSPLADPRGVGGGGILRMVGTPSSHSRRMLRTLPTNAPDWASAPTGSHSQNPKCTIHCDDVSCLLRRQLQERRIRRKHLRSGLVPHHRRSAVCCGTSRPRDCKIRLFKFLSV